LVRPRKRPNGGVDVFFKWPFRLVYNIEVASARLVA